AHGFLRAGSSASSTPSVLDPGPMPEAALVPDRGTLRKPRAGRPLLTRTGHLGACPSWHLTTILRDNLLKMLAVLPAITHPDGDLALFGDSQRGRITPAALAAGCSHNLPQKTSHDAPASGVF